ncbi:hypothetical protein K0028_09750 [Curtobacterium flaccumfaciens pv. flaccumfaciens]|nr:hypothetical protein [Curtobacterium flaccumfaciens]MBB1195896.1 hypothetical protein [Curtobacterium flaccumfaciens]MBF4626043.1 hypothetical protein [Curtobacterium flaccumfaciens]MCS6554745.1 hypothetical protein [Curtobacterium flaccumfaciens]QYI96012.1 hypothetical protein K0028_09750 [Curtobacterium flaccumfaciens pv. flaccumfaciens]UXN20959.1 hypothetical protein N8D77_12425 [Curtobacterium flaccumfaciens pv. flaccumfaciens]
MPNLPAASRGPLMQLVAVNFASILVIAIFAQGSLTRGTYTVHVLQARFPTLPAIVLCVLTALLAVMVLQRRCQLSTATWIIIAVAALLCVFANVHTQSWLLGWDQWSGADVAPWWSNTRADTYEAH